jgi:3D (Asp-Asp-Asp) domain-containing protein
MPRLRVVFALTVAGFLLVGAGLVPHAGRHAAGADRACPPQPPSTARQITSPRWIGGASVTEYYPVREAWFSGRRIPVPGLPDRHRVDWLYGPHGVAMNGEGLGLDGRFEHFAGPFGIGWVNRDGQGTRPCWNATWTNGPPAWLAFGWRNRRGQVTFPLGRGGWSNGPALRYLVPPAGLRFGPGRTRSLPFWHAVAVDPKVIPYGSRVFIPAYCRTPAHGWFRALDTGGAIIGFHFDVYRAPPATLELHALRRQRVYVAPPGRALPALTSARCPR